MSLLFSFSFIRVSVSECYVISSLLLFHFTFCIFISSHSSPLGMSQPARPSWPSQTHPSLLQSFEGKANQRAKESQINIDVISHDIGLQNNAIKCSPTPSFAYTLLTYLLRHYYLHNTAQPAERKTI